MAQRWPIVLAAFYFLGGVAAWYFLSNQADGLGYVGLRMYVLPVSLIGMGLSKLAGAEFIFVPSGLDPATGNALFFFPSLALLTWLVGWQMPAMYRKMMED